MISGLLSLPMHRGKCAHAGDYFNATGLLIGTLRYHHGHWHCCLVFQRSNIPMESAASLPGEVLHRWQGRELETPADSETPPASPSSDVSLSLRDSNRLAFERNQSAIQIAGIEAVSLPVVRTTAPTPPPGTAHADFAEAWASIQIKPSPLGQNSKADSVLQQGLSDVRPGDESASQPAPRLEESDADLIVSDESACEYLDT
jgi:hypothetical protein